MNKTHLPIRIASLALMVVGAGLLALNILSHGRYNIALPLVFLVLGGAFTIVVFSLREKAGWAVFLYIPAGLLIAFGIIFLLNVITGDWNAWAYAWLLLLVGLGVGLLLVNRERPLHPAYSAVGWGLTLAGITFFAVFGAITGGLLIQVMAPVLLVAAGLSLRWLHLEDILPVGLRQKWGFAARAAGEPEPVPAPDGLEALVEPLSSRELEVLRLIDRGLSNQQIADQLTVAPSTVKTHINNLYGKLGVQTRVQAVNRAHALHLLGE